jgi:hypothetical protein
MAKIAATALLLVLCKSLSILFPSFFAENQIAPQ